MSASSKTTPIAGKYGKSFVIIYCPFLGAMGAGGGALLAHSVKNQAIASEFWTQILTVVGLSALPIVVVAMKVPAYAIDYATWKWRAVSSIAVVLAFALVLIVVGISMHEIARVVPEGKPPPHPHAGELYAACMGTGVILAAVAAGIVVAFFEPFGSMEGARTRHPPGRATRPGAIDLLDS